MGGAKRYRSVLVCESDGFREGQSSYELNYEVIPRYGIGFRNLPDTGYVRAIWCAHFGATERFLALRATTNLSSQINLIPPVQPLLQKYFSSPTGRSSNRGLPSRTCQRGVSRSSRTLGGGCGGRGHVKRRMTLIRVRRSRVVLIPRRWNQIGDDACASRR